MDANTIIDRLGGTSKVAAICGRTKSAVSQWRRNGIPEAWERFLRTQHPEAFGEQYESPAPAAHPLAENGSDVALPPPDAPFPVPGAAPADLEADHDYPLPVQDDRRTADWRTVEDRRHGGDRRDDPGSD